MFSRSVSDPGSGGGRRGGQHDRRGCGHVTHAMTRRDPHRARPVAGWGESALIGLPTLERAGQVPAAITRHEDVIEQVHVDAFARPSARPGRRTQSSVTRNARIIARTATSPSGLAIGECWIRPVTTATPASSPLTVHGHTANDDAPSRMFATATRTSVTASAPPPSSTARVNREPDHLCQADPRVMLDGKVGRHRRQRRRRIGSRERVAC